MRGRSKIKTAKLADELKGEKIQAKKLGNVKSNYYASTSLSKENENSVEFIIKKNNNWRQFEKGNENREIVKIYKLEATKNEKEDIKLINEEIIKKVAKKIIIDWSRIGWKWKQEE